jgi:cathepsin B
MGSCHHPGCSDEPTPPCKTANTCADKSAWTLSHAASSYGIRSSADAIATEIMTNGPVTAAFSVYEDFAHYTSGIYKHTSGQFLGGHAIEIIGWGTQNNTAYWVCFF